MEMVMTNIYTFPPITSGDELERINAQERQVGVLCLSSVMADSFRNCITSWFMICDIYIDLSCENIHCTIFFVL